MKKDSSPNIQSKIFDRVRKAIGDDEPMALVLSDVPSLSTDVVYRRMHDILNYLHTTNDRYVGDTKAVIDRQLLDVNLISEVNHKDRHKCFKDLFASINAAQFERIPKR